MHLSLPERVAEAHTARDLEVAVDLREGDGAVLTVDVDARPPCTMTSSPTFPTGPVPVGRDRIVIDGLVVDAYIGVLDSERQQRQRVRFDVEITTVDGYADTVRATGEYVSYADIVAYIEARAASDDHVDLVETWADDVAERVLRHRLAESCTVRVTKPDIFESADGVGITIERRRGDGAP